MRQQRRKCHVTAYYIETRTTGPEAKQADYLEQRNPQRSTVQLHEQTARPRRMHAHGTAAAPRPTSWGCSRPRPGGFRIRQWRRGKLRGASICELPPAPQLSAQAPRMRARTQARCPRSAWLGSSQGAQSAPVPQCTRPCGLAVRTLAVLKSRACPALTRCRSPHQGRQLQEP